MENTGNQETWTNLKTMTSYTIVGFGYNADEYVIVISDHEGTQHTLNAERARNEGFNRAVLALESWIQQAEEEGLPGKEFAEVAPPAESEAETPSAPKAVAAEGEAGAEAPPELDSADRAAPSVGEEEEAVSRTERPLYIEAMPGLGKTTMAKNHEGQVIDFEHALKSATHSDFDADHEKRHEQYREAFHALQPMLNAADARVVTLHPVLTDSERRELGAVLFTPSKTKLREIQQLRPDLTKSVRYPLSKYQQDAAAQRKQQGVIIVEEGEYLEDFVDVDTGRLTELGLARMEGRDQGQAKAEDTDAE